MMIKEKDMEEQEDNKEHRKKLLEILERQKYKHAKLHNLKLILQEGSPTNTELKKQLSSLLGEDFNQIQKIGTKQKS